MMMWLLARLVQALAARPDFPRHRGPTVSIEAASASAFDWSGPFGMPPPALIEPAEYDAAEVTVDLEGIRRFNPQRFEMEQLTGIFRIDESKKLIVGFKDVREDEFWVLGHMPGYPLMPGILMCEAAAQLCSYFCKHIHLTDGAFLGFGGMENVRFRGQVRPGQRLIVTAQALKLNRRQTTFETQGFVEGSMVFHAQIIGVAIPEPAESA